MRYLINLALIFFLAVIFPQAKAQDDNLINPIKDNTVYKEGESFAVKKFMGTGKTKKIKNVILMIGDGMGVSQIFSGLVANRGNLYLKNFSDIGFITTQSANDFVTDSGAGGTALSCGEKTYNKAIGVGVDSIPIQNIREKAEAKGCATGIISSSSITHATPASFVAHQLNRDMYEEIASDFLNTNIDVFIGGGLKNFTDRKDSTDLTLSLKIKGYQVVSGIDSISKVTKGKLAGFTSWEHNKKMIEGRGNVLPVATKTAIKILSNRGDKGFFLMVEGSQIDFGGHENNTRFIVTEMVDFDQAIGVALEFAARDKETLVIVTADHETGGFAITGGDFNTGKVIGNFITVEDSSFNGHTAVMVPVFAFGPGAENFRGFHDNTDIPKIIGKLAGY